MKARDKAGCCKDGNSFLKPLGETITENTGIELVSSPREGSTPAPEQVPLSFNTLKWKSGGGIL